MAERAMIDEILGNLDREVYGVFGIPVDAVDRRTSQDRIQLAAAQLARVLLSTPNLNFLFRSTSDTDFRESLLQSDLCVADGAPVVWLARLAGAPIRERVAGSDLFEALKADARRPPLKVFLFGGPPGVAEEACDALNSTESGMVCVGWHDPGFGTIDSMSTDSILSKINASGADFLSVSLGAQKGQAWLMLNHDQLKIPVRVHLGATINFQAGSVQRAPRILCNSGLEWLWRIKEEPQLWRRYWGDAWGLARLLVTCALPLVARRLTEGRRRRGRDFGIECTSEEEATLVRLTGPATVQEVDRAVSVFRDALSRRMPITIDMAAATAIDARFIGLLLMVRKIAKEHGGMTLSGVSRPIRTSLHLNGFDYLLDDGEAQYQSLLPATRRRTISSESLSPALAS